MSRITGIAAQDAGSSEVHHVRIDGVDFEADMREAVRVSLKDVEKLRDIFGDVRLHRVTTTFKLMLGETESDENARN